MEKNSDVKKNPMVPIKDFSLFQGIRMLPVLPNRLSPTIRESVTVELSEREGSEASAEPSN
jgi:hypothetical protein